MVYFPWDADRTFWEVLDVDHAKLLRNAVLWATKGTAAAVRDWTRCSRCLYLVAATFHDGSLGESYKSDDDERPDSGNHHSGPPGGADSGSRR